MNLPENECDIQPTWEADQGWYGDYAIQLYDTYGRWRWNIEKDHADGDENTREKAKAAATTAIRKLVFRDRLIDQSLHLIKDEPCAVCGSRASEMLDDEHCVQCRYDDYERSVEDSFMIKNHRIAELEAAAKHWLHEATEAGKLVAQLEVELEELRKNLTPEPKEEE